MQTRLIFRAYVTATGERRERPEPGKTNLAVSLYGPAPLFTVTLDPVGDYQRNASGMPFTLDGVRRLNSILSTLIDLAEHYEIQDDV